MMNKNQKSNLVPPFRHIADYLRKKIHHGEYAPGQMLPTMKEIANRFKVHRHTVESGIKLLENENLVISRPGSGTMVKESFKKVALLLPDADSVHWQRVAKAIGFRLQCADLEIDILRHHGSARTFRKQVNKLAAGRYAGAMISASPEQINTYMPLTALVENGFPVTFIGSGLAGVGCRRVDDGDFAGAYLGTRHLLECRFKYIGMIGCPYCNGGEFLRGGRKALSEFNREPVATEYAKNEKAALSRLESWLEADDIRLDSVFFQRSEHAQKAFGYLQARGIQIGGGIGVITFDDTQFHRLTIPSPTVIRRYPERLGGRVADMFVEQLSAQPEHRSCAKTIEADIGLEFGRSTGDHCRRMRSSAPVFRIEIGAKGSTF
jgi:DNA-binding LacI/PurR family transcriptional regulator